MQNVYGINNPLMNMILNSFVFHLISHIIDFIFKKYSRYIHKFICMFEKIQNNLKPIHYTKARTEASSEMSV